MCRSGLLSLFVWLVSASAFADAVPPPPTSCPEGARVVDFCHGPQTCRIASCSSATDCNPGEVCLPRALCLREHCCSGIGCVLDGSTPTRYMHVAGPCNAGGSCSDVGTTCQTESVCVAVTSTDGGSPGSDGGGSDGGGAGVDSGPPEADSGAGGMDGGGGSDSGAPGAMDAGPGGGSDGGCCAVYGTGHPFGGPVAAVFLALALWRGRRRG